MAPTTRTECPVCNKTIAPNEAKTSCLVCKTPFHDHCVLSVGLLAADVLRMKQTTSTFHFVCRTCKTNVQHVATPNELELRAKILKMEADAAVQLHAANSMADAAENEKISLKKLVQDLTRKIEHAGASTSETQTVTATITRNRELQAENKKLNAALARYDKMEEELASLKEITDKIPAFRAEYEKVVKERDERDASMARYTAYIKDIDENNAVRANMIKDLQLEIEELKKQRQPVASTSQQSNTIKELRLEIENLKKQKQPVASTSQHSNKRHHTDMETSKSTDLINFADIETHIDNAIGNRFLKIEESQRLMTVAMDQIRAALLTNMPAVNFSQAPRIQRSSTPGAGARARSVSRKSQGTQEFRQRPVKMSYAAALTKSTIRPDVIRNINILGTPDEVKSVLQELREGTHVKGPGIASVKINGNH